MDIFKLRNKKIYEESPEKSIQLETDETYEFKINLDKIKFDNKPVVLEVKITYRSASQIEEQREWIHYIVISS